MMPGKQTILVTRAAGRPRARPVTMADFIRTLGRMLGVRAALDFQPTQPGDVAATRADTRRLRAWVGYAPATPLETDLARFPEWYNPRSTIRPA